MSAAEHQPPNSSPNSDTNSLKKPPRRPSLQGPPSRPSQVSESVDHKTEKPSLSVTKPPTVPVEEDPDTPSTEPSRPPKPALHPISPPSEPMQYRAIGLVRGIYTPQEEQLNRGQLMTEAGTEIEAVLLGRITSLVKKHIDLEAPHLWVVYPRTRKDERSPEQNPPVDLHLQIVGIWEPETLGMPGENPVVQTADDDSAAPSEPADAAETTPELTVTDNVTPEPTDTLEESGESESVASVVEEKVTVSDLEPAASESTEPEAVALPTENYFSIRGEVLKYDEDIREILVKIVQGAKRDDQSQKSFRLHISGEITGKTVGYFWELDVERQGSQLVLTEGRMIKIVPPAKNKRKGKPMRGGGKPRPNQGPPRRRQSAGQPQPKTKPRIRPSAPVKSNPL
ncbi:MAG: hypothetical protein AAFX01_13495 [Cyanobacteria bacterium J06638_28]